MSDDTCINLDSLRRTQDHLPRFALSFHMPSLKRKRAIVGATTTLSKPSPVFPQICRGRRLVPVSVLEFRSGISERPANRGSARTHCTRTPLQRKRSHPRGNGRRYDQQCFQSNLANSRCMPRRSRTRCRGMFPYCNHYAVSKRLVKTERLYQDVLM